MQDVGWAFEPHVFDPYSSGDQANIGQGLLAFHTEPARRTATESADPDLGTASTHPCGTGDARSLSHQLLGRFSHRQRAIYGLA